MRLRDTYAAKREHHAANTNPQVVAAVVKAFGLTPSYNISSTDSNFPISLGIPAVTIGRGRGGRAHSLDEWVDVEKAAQVQAAQVAVVTFLAMAGVR